jgi:SAM-dependent methyltransferase
MTGYHDTRLTRDPKRDRVWKALWRYYFRHRIGADDTVLDLGCGYGEFINNVVSRERIALDIWPGFERHLAPGVRALCGPATDLSRIADRSLDHAFASNVFEHLTQRDVAETLAQLRAKLKPTGRLTLLQPNYRYCASEYFDDYTHMTVWSHVSLADFLAAHGFEVVDLHPRFLPLTVKSRLPAWEPLVALYLALPFKPMGKQMLVSARPR